MRTTTGRALRLTSSKSLRTAAVVGIATIVAVLGGRGALSARPIDDGWTSYGNARFNYAICFPPSFKGQGEATDSDGEVFKSADGARLTVFGANELPGDRLDQDLQAVVVEIAGKGARITYRVQKPDWLVASGVGPVGEFYLKRVQRRDQMLSFEFLYSARLHAKYAPVVAKIARCFTHGSDDGDG